MGGGVRERKVRREGGRGEGEREKAADLKTRDSRRDMEVSDAPTTTTRAFTEIWEE